jgi:hypothetical protein
MLFVQSVSMNRAAQVWPAPYTQSSYAATRPQALPSLQEVDMRL